MKTLRKRDGTACLIGSASEAAQTGQHILGLLFGRGPCACSPCREPRFLPLPLHESGPENALGLVLVVRAASHPHVVDRRLPSSRQRFDMVEFEKPARLAARPLRAHEGALALIPLPDRAPDVRRGVTPSGGRAGSGRTPLRPAGADPELTFLELCDQGIE